MARRRLTPAAPGSAGNVPRAEHPLETRTFTGFSPTAPIARQAAEAAGIAALEEMAETLHRARDEGRMVLDLPLGGIAPDHLARDRLAVEDGEMAGLRESLRLHGQRMPIEVTPLTAGLPYGLISGWRRLTALKALLAETGDVRFATVRALVRRPETAAAAYVSMVEENEVRLGLSQYERARVAALATERGVFASEKQALLALFAAASRAKRSRIRAFLEIYHALDGVLRFPAHLPERLGLKLVEMVRAGEGARIAAALRHAGPRTPEAELDVLAELARPAPATRKPRSTGADRPSGITLEETLEGHRLTLRFEGAAVTPAFRTEVLRLLQGLARPG